MFHNTPSVPGIGTSYTATPNTILDNTNGALYLEGGRVIDGSKSRDWTNPTAPHFLTSGTILGKITASGKYAPSILGILQSNASSGATSLSVSIAQATEILRRMGNSGTATISIAGPPAAAGTVASQTLTFSNVNTGTGAITVTATGAAFTAGSIIYASDGSGVPLVILHGGSDGPTTMRDLLNTTDLDIQGPRLLVGGPIIDANLPGFSLMAAEVQAYLKTQLRAKGQTFRFKSDF